MNNRPNPKEPSLARQYPTLEGLKIPDALKTAIRRAYQHIYDLRDDMLQRFAAAGDGGCCTLFKGTVPTVGDLPTTGNEIGDGWIVESTGHLWFWDGTAWVDAGSVTGPPGPAGPAGPAGPPGTSGASNPFRTGHTFALLGDVTAITVLPSMFVPLRSGQAATLVGLRAKINSGTSIGAQVRRNGSNVGSVVTVTTTAATTTLSQTLADGDELTLTLSSPVGTPTSLGATLILEHTP